MNPWWMEKAKVKFAVTLQLHIILLMLLVLVSGSSCSYLLSPSNVQEAIAFTAADSSVLIPNKINFTVPQEVSILYPVNWNAVKGVYQSEGMNSIITLRLLSQNDTDDSLAILNIARFDLGTTNMTTEQYANGQLLFLKGSISDFKLIQFNRTTLAGRPAYQTVYNGLEGTDETTTMKLWLVDQSSLGSTAYTITYSAKPENYPNHLASAKEMVESFAIQEKVGKAPFEELLEAELLQYIPEPSRQELGNITKLPNFKSILGGNLTNFIDFIKGTTNIPPSNFATLPTDPNNDIAIHYHLSSAYLNPINNVIYAILVLVFTDNTSNRALVEPIHYGVSFNGSDYNFRENGSTSTGLDIKILNGTSLEEALKKSQEYKLGVDIINMNRIAFRETRSLSMLPM